MIKILIVEFDANRAKQIAALLRQMDYTVLLAGDEQEALSVLEKNSIQLIVANADCGGIFLCQELRDAEDSTPFLVISEASTGQERRRIFRSGADGYIATPLDSEELQMRVRNLLWRCKIVEDSTLRFGNCCLHAQTLTIETQKGDIELRRMEFLLLQKLLSYPGRIFTRAQLMDELWGYDSQSDSRTVDTHIRRLRKKLHDVEDIRLQGVRGIGYRAAVPRRVRKEEKKRKETLE